MKTLGHLLLQDIKLSPGQEWSDEGEAWRFVRLDHGAAYWLGAPKPRCLVEGELLVIPPAIPGVVRASQLNDVILHGFGFTPDLLCGLLTLAERRFFERGTPSRQSEVQFLPSTHPATQRFAALAAETSSRESLGQRLEALGIVVALFDQDLAQHQPPDPLGTSVAHRFEQLIAQMPDTELIHQNPAQLAQLCHCSPRHFNRLFHKQFGVSVRTRQTELRLLKARQLLTETDAKVIEIALDSGYRNLGLFNSLFKRRFGMTPTEWRLKSSDAAKTAVSLGLALLLGVLAAAPLRAQSSGTALQFSDTSAGHVVKPTPDLNTSSLPFWHPEHDILARLHLVTTVLNFKL